MTDFVSSSDNPPIMYSASSSEVAVDVSFEDVCSICLEPFNTQDPPTVTKCKHEYHLQCILEWSQRSKECPICWQLLVLKDHASQELLAAVESERNSRSRLKVHYIHEDHEIDHGASYMDDSDFDERVLWHFSTTASNRVHFVNRRGRQRSSGFRPSQVLSSVPTAAAVQMHTSPEECQNSGYGLAEIDSPTSGTPSAIISQIPLSSAVPSVVNVVSSSAGNGNRDDPVKPRILYNKPPPGSSQRSSSSELLTFSESIKSRFSAASTRYKESISKSTRGFKEKLLARNSSVKELSRGVQREMSAGIASVAKIIERLDLASKRTEVFVPSSNCKEEASNFSCKGKGVQENVIAQSIHGNTGEAAHDMSLRAPHVSNTVPGRLEVSLVQSGN